MLHLENIPSRLKQRNQWILWRGKPKANGKLDKIPFDPRTGSGIDHFNPENQLSFDECVSIWNQFKSAVSGIG